MPSRLRVSLLAAAFIIGPVLAVPQVASAETPEKNKANPAPSRLEYYRQQVPKAARVDGGKAPWVLFRPYRSELTERIDRIHQPGESAWIDAAWAIMELKTGIIPEQNRQKLASAILELWETHPAGSFYGHKGLQAYVTKKHGINVAGDVMIARTNPPQRQQMAVRRKLLKVICLMHEFQAVLLETADEYKNAVMPGYTHIRHAQPTTFGHYLLSVYDPIDRSVKMLENGYSAMSLNELGCGALAGTSWPIDRELVSTYLGTQGLIENTNDAVSYSDGYVMVTAAATNVMTVLSRMALELEFWSTQEYDFLDFEIGAGSFMMPNKRSNQGTLEEVLEGTSKVLGDLVQVASMGMRIPHGDMQPMAYRMDDGTLDALKQIDLYVEPLLYKFATIIVKEDVMLATARQGYSCSTELANELCRQFGLDYRTAHDVVNHFVVESAKQGIPSREANLDVFQQACETVLHRKLDINEARLREVLDPTYFVKVTDCRGGVAPEEVARMIEVRKKKLAESRARNLARIEKLEDAKQRMLADLREICELPKKPTP